MINLKVISLFLLVIVALITSIYFYQRHLIYLPHKTHIETSEFGATQMKEVRLRTQDGIDIFGWYSPAKPNFPTILYFHGNRGHIGNRVKLIDPYIFAGYGVFLLEYRGYADNKGKPTEQGLYQDARAAMAFLYKQGVPYNNIVLYGESLGTGVAVQLATEYCVAGLILQSPYSSMTKLGQYYYPYLPVKMLLKDRYESIKKIKRVKVPILIIFHQQDSIVPAKHSQALYEAANLPKFQVVVSDAGIDHNNLLTSTVYKSVFGFLKHIQELH